MACSAWLTAVWDTETTSLSIALQVAVYAIVIAGRVGALQSLFGLSPFGIISWTAGPRVLLQNNDLNGHRAAVDGDADVLRIAAQGQIEESASDSQIAQMKFVDERR